MTIGAISFQPYVYNVNAISPASMNRLSRISDDVLDKKTDFTGLTEAENENPLKRGQTLDFQGMLEMQMRRGRSNAARVMKPQAQAETDEAQEAERTQDDAAVKFDRAEAGRTLKKQETEAAESGQQAAVNMGNGSAGSDISHFRMQQAISAYEMFMTA